MSDARLIPLRPPSCPPVLHLEEWVTGQVHAGVEPHLTSCRECAAHVAALRQEQAAFFRQHPAELFAHQVRRRPSQRPWLRLLSVVLPTLVIALSVVFARSRSSDEEVRLKGQRRFSVVYKQTSMLQAESVRADQRLSAGAALRFSYAAERDGYVAVLNLDSAGKATPFYPWGGTQAASLRSGDEGFFPGSVVLDASTGPEWLVAVFATEPFELSPLLAQLEQAPLPTQDVRLRCTGCLVEALRIVKVP